MRMDKPGERQRRWRELNPERAREYRREYLRRKWLQAFLADMDAGEVSIEIVGVDHAHAVVPNGTACPPVL